MSTLFLPHTNKPRVLPHLLHVEATLHPVQPVVHLMWRVYLYKASPEIQARFRQDCEGLPVKRRRQHPIQYYLHMTAKRREHVVSSIV